MVPLRARVTCDSCTNPVDKLKTRLLPTLEGQRRYQCFDCFKQGASTRATSPLEGKQLLYCERCKYQFSSQRRECPYCNKKDFVTKGEITLRDLL